MNNDNDVTLDDLKQALSQRNSAHVRLKRAQAQIRKYQQRESGSFMPAVVWLKENGYSDIAETLEDAQELEVRSKMDQQTIKDKALEILSSYQASPGKDPQTGWSQPRRLLENKFSRLQVFGPYALGLKAKSTARDMDEMVNRILEEIGSYSPWKEAGEIDYGWKAALDHHTKAIERMPLMSRSELIEEPS